MKSIYILKYVFNCVNFKYECDVFCVILIFLIERLVSVNVEIVCEFVVIVWNIEIIFCNLVVGCVVV